MEVNSIFLGKKVRKYWEIVENTYSEPKLEVKTETIERIKVLERVCKLIYNKGEEIFLNDIEKYCTVEKRTSDLDGNMIYNITYVVESIEDFDRELEEEYNKKLLEYRENKRLKEIEDNKKREENRLKEEQELKEYNLYIENKKNVKKKGIVIQNIPLNDGRPSMTMKDIENMHKYMNKCFEHYDVITTYTNLEIFNYDENGNIESINKNNIIHEN